MSRSSPLIGDDLHFGLDLPTGGGDDSLQQPSPAQLSSLTLSRDSPTVVWFFDLGAQQILALVLTLLLASCLSKLLKMLHASVSPVEEWELERATEVKW